MKFRRFFPNRKPGVKACFLHFFSLTRIFSYKMRVCAFFFAQKVRFYRMKLVYSHQLLTVWIKPAFCVCFKVYALSDSSNTYSEPSLQ